jgi:hypothetical protein
MIMGCHYPGVAGKIEVGRGIILVEPPSTAYYLWVANPQVAFEIARKARDTIQSLLLPGVQQNPLHPFGGVNTR